MVNSATIRSKQAWQTDGVTEQDLFVLKMELGKSIRALDGDPKSLSRIANIATQRIGLVQSLVHAERLLESRRAK